MSLQRQHVPIRTCVVCREKRQRIQLLRIVKTPEGQIMFDEFGRLEGRGAYVCGDADHWGSESQSNGVVRGRLKGALKTEIDDSTMNRLGETIRSLLAGQQI